MRLERVIVLIVSVRDYYVSLAMPKPPEGRHMRRSDMQNSFADSSVQQVADRPSAGNSFETESAVRRGWTLFIACAGVALVIASMIALNTALSDIALATAADQTQLTWIVDSTRSSWRACFCRRVRSVTDMGGAAPCWWVWRFLVRLP